MAVPSSRIDELRRRVDDDPASLAFAALAEEYRRLGRFQEAVDTCRTGLTRHPAYVSARVTLGRALLEMGDQEAARIEFEQVVRQAPENLAAIRGLAEICRRPAEGLQQTGTAGPPAPSETHVGAAGADATADATPDGADTASSLQEFLDAIRRTRAELGH